MSLAIEEQLDLERAIEQQINLGQNDPHEMFDILRQRLGDEKVKLLAEPYLADLVTNIARQRMNALRRAEIAKIKETTIETSEVLLRSLWVPSESGIVYKRIADMTADDFDARAAYLERMVMSITRHAHWCREVAADIRRHKVETAGRLPRLPGLPELE